MEITANAVQTVAAGNNVLFTDAPIPGNPSIIHRDDSGLVTLRGLTNQCRARFRIYFNGNIAIPSGTSSQAISVAIAIAGEQIQSTIMQAMPTDNNFWNVSASVFVDVPAGCCSVISVKNTSTTAINVQNANFIIERVA